MKAGRASIGIFQKMRIENLRRSVRSDFKKTRLLHLGNVEKPPQPQFSAQRAFEGCRGLLKISQIVTRGKRTGRS